MNDYLIRMTSKDGNLRAVAAVTTDLCETSRKMQGTDPTATVALARMATGTALLGALLKGDQRLAMIIEGNGPLQKLHAETDAAGHLRCSVKQPLAALPPRDNRFDVSGAVGRAGFLSVIKDLGLKDRYRGTVQLQTSEIGEDLAYYLTTSEQTPSSVSLGVSLSPSAEIQAAGGLLVQALPGCTEEILDTVEKQLMTLSSLSGEILAGKTPEQILTTLFGAIPFTLYERIPLAFRCNCNRKQIEGILLSLGQDELSATASGDEPVSVTCEYCRKTYDFSPTEVAALLN
jgi:molecular chaperone Hsp33